MPSADDLAREAAATFRRLRHAMRTELGQILGYAELLMDDARERDETQAVTDLGRIHGAAQRLLDTVDEVFTPGDEPVPDASEGDTSAEGGAVPGGKGCILLVEDEAAIRDPAVEALVGMGFDATGCDAGVSALRRLDEEAFDLVLLTLELPDMDGFEVLKRIRQSHSPTELPVIMVTDRHESADVVRALRKGANDYVTSPMEMVVLVARIESQLAVRAAHQRTRRLARQLELRNAFIRQTFGRYVSDEVARDILENPESFNVNGEKRIITILMSDLRGFSTLSERLQPVQVVTLINNYLTAMTEVIQRHGGTIDEFLGDGILAFFGAPRQAEDDARRAVICALEMQAAMAGVNETNRSEDLPEVAMGIGVATGGVIVGNIGSSRRAKYGAVGAAVNLAARLESLTLGGQVLVCDRTLEAAGEGLITGESREIEPKGFSRPVPVFPLLGLEGRSDLRRVHSETRLRELADPVALRVAALKDKVAVGTGCRATVVAGDRNGARLRVHGRLPAASDVRLTVSGEAARNDHSYAKVLERTPDGTLTVQFTSLAPLLLEALEERAVDDTGRDASAGTPG